MVTVGAEASKLTWMTSLWVFPALSKRVNVIVLRAGVG